MMMVLMKYVEVLKVVDVMKLLVQVRVVSLFECEMWIWLFLVVVCFWLLWY